MTTATTTKSKYPEAGNWQSFDSFCWYEKPDNADQWCLYYTHNRDSTLLDQSNAAAIDKMMRRFKTGKHPTCLEQRHNHWVCGWVDGYAIKVVNSKGKPTKAYEKLCDILDDLANYPVLDEEDYSRREYEATSENVAEATKLAWGSINKSAWPENIECPDPHQVEMWISESKDYRNELESMDDMGGYPSDKAVIAAIEAIIEKTVINPPPKDVRGQLFMEWAA